MSTPSSEDDVEVVSPRRNGWSWPWHPQQVLAWVAVLVLVLFWFGFTVQYVPGLYRIPFYLLSIILLLVQVVSMAAATSVNPGELSFRRKMAELGSGGPISRPKFNRAKHKHVIENHYCKLCQVQVNESAKHCRLCDKCVSDFDHHCKWLNNCVGSRNYRWFLASVWCALVSLSALLLISASLFVLFFAKRDYIRFNCSSSHNVTACPGEIRLFGGVVPDPVFPVLCGVASLLSLVCVGFLGHLATFHIFLRVRGQTTYEYFIGEQRETKPQTESEQTTRTNNFWCFCLKRTKSKTNKVMPSEALTGSSPSHGAREVGVGTVKEVGVAYNLETLEGGSTRSSVASSSTGSAGMATFGRTPPPDSDAGGSEGDGVDGPDLAGGGGAVLEPRGAEPVLVNSRTLDLEHCRTCSPTMESGHTGSRMDEHKHVITTMTWSHGDGIEGDGGVVKTRQDSPATRITVHVEVEPTSQEVEPSYKEVEPESKEVEPESKEVEPDSKEVEYGCKENLNSNEVELVSREVEPVSREVEPVSMQVEPHCMPPSSQEMVSTSQESCQNVNQISRKMKFDNDRANSSQRILSPKEQFPETLATNSSHLFTSSPGGSLSSDQWKGHVLTDSSRTSELNAVGPPSPVRGAHQDSYADKSVLDDSVLLTQVTPPVPLPQHHPHGHASSLGSDPLLQSSEGVLTRVPLPPIPTEPLPPEPIPTSLHCDGPLTLSSQTLHKRVSFQHLDQLPPMDDTARPMSRFRPLPPIGSTHQTDPLSPPGRRLPPLPFAQLGSSQDVVSLCSAPSYSHLLTSNSGSTISLPVFPDPRYSAITRNATPSHQRHGSLNRTTGHKRLSGKERTKKMRGTKKEGKLESSGPQEDKVTDELVESSEAVPVSVVHQVPV